MNTLIESMKNEHGRNNAWSGIIELTAARIAGKRDISLGEWLGSANAETRRKLIGLHFDALVKEFTRRYLAPQLKELATAASAEAVRTEKRNRLRLLLIMFAIAAIYGTAWTFGRLFLTSGGSLGSAEVLLIIVTALAGGLPVSFYYAYRFHKRSAALHFAADIFERAGTQHSSGKQQ